MKHTAGPWEVVKHHHATGDLWLSVNQCADARGMKEWLAEVKYRGAEPERQWADARLMAAAPDLLQAVVQLTDPWIDRYQHQDQLGDRCACESCVRTRALAAIAKATGESLTAARAGEE